MRPSPKSVSSAGLISVEIGPVRLRNELTFRSGAQSSLGAARGRLERKHLLRHSGAIKNARSQTFIRPIQPVSGRLSVASLIPRASLFIYPLRPRGPNERARTSPFRPARPRAFPNEFKIETKRGSSPRPFVYLCAAAYCWIRHLSAPRPLFSILPHGFSCK